MKETLPQISNDLINWQSLISALIGGVLVIAGQLIIECIKSRKEKKRRIIFLSSKAKEIEQHLFNELRELAMFKTHANYWWFSHRKGTSTEEFNKKYYNEHLRSQSESRLTEKKIGTKIAEYFGIINEYLTLVNGQTVGIVTNLEKIKKIEFGKAVDYELSENFDDVRNKKVEKDEKELKSEYWNLIKPITEINEVLYNKANKIA